MSKLLSVVVAAAFAAASFSTMAQTKDAKKMEVKSPQAGGVMTQDKKAVTTATPKPKEAPKAAPAPKKAPPAAKPKAETGKTELRSAQGGPVTTQDKKGVAAKSK